MSGSFGAFMLALESVSGISWGRYGSRSWMLLLGGLWDLVITLQKCRRITVLRNARTRLILGSPNYTYGGMPSYKWLLSPMNTPRVVPNH